MKRMILPLIILLLIMTASVISFPRLSVEHGVNCINCHINPTGGGMRNEFGNYSVALNELCLPQTKKHFIKRYKQPRLSESVLFGFDTRHLVFDDLRVFRMQTDIFLNVEPLKNIFYHIRFWENGISEHYALLYFNKKKYFVKAGRFYPSFGLRNADHKAFNRERTGHGSNVYLDGLSAGAEINGGIITAEIFNPNQRGVYGLHMFKGSYIGNMGYLLGASLRLSEEINGSNGTFPHVKAVFGGLSYDRFTLMGELDLEGQSNDTLITYANLTTRIEYGLYIITEYNFFDGNRHLSEGVDELVRFSIELYPMPFFQLRPSYTYYTRGYRENEDDFFLMIHFGY
ncbi:MAG: hypothetical protein ACE5D6_03025 [Candidatus Zixiibacteriota bacterium]